MGAVVLAVRFALAATFALSALAKFRRPAALERALTAFGVPAPRAVGRLLPPVEAAVAAALVAALDRSWPAWLAVAVLGSFTVAVVVHLASGRAAPCPCFDPDSRRPASAATVARNGILVALGVLATGSTDGAGVAATVAAGLVTVPATIVVLRRFG